MLSTDKQTDRQTDKLTNATKNITSFAKEVKSKKEKKEKKNKTASIDEVIKEVREKVEEEQKTTATLLNHPNSAPPNDDAPKDDELSDLEADTEITEMDTTVVMDQKEKENQETIGTEGWVDVKGRRTGKRANSSSNVETEEISAKKKKSCSGKGEPNSKP